jgi:hypothetical protein
MTKAINSVSPAIDQFEAKMIIAGASSEEAADAVEKRFGPAIKNLGLLRTPTDLKKSDKALKDSEDALKAAQQGRIDAADDWFGNEEAIETANVSRFESERKLSSSRRAINS